MILVEQIIGFVAPQPFHSDIEEGPSSIKAICVIRSCQQNSRIHPGYRSQDPSDHLRNQ